jgi:hypothetical protein
MKSFTNCLCSVLFLLLLAPVCPATNSAAVATPMMRGRNLLRNSDFARGLQFWSLWQHGRTHPQWATVISQPGRLGNYNALRITNPKAVLVGVQQTVTVLSNRVYRLAGSARSLLTNDSSRIFGGRIAFYLPPQPERQLVWTSEFNDWWKRDLVFTNKVTGVGLVLVHMGYGGVVSTGDFSDVRLEIIE